MDDATIEALEYPVVLRELSSLAATGVGREKALDLTPSFDITEIRDSLKLLTEGVSAIKDSGVFSFEGIEDIRAVLLSPKLEGAYMAPEELLSVFATAGSMASLGSRSTPVFAGRYPLLGALLSELPSYGGLITELSRTIDEKGNIRDDASKGLLRVRQELSLSRERCRALLEGFLGDKELSSSLQEEFFTLRDDRYVLSVKAGSHTGVPGVIHGRSQTGSTYFIEPLQTVEVNNRIAILKKEERTEEVKVLKRATSVVMDYADVLLSGLELSAKVDLLQARVGLKERLGGIVPEVTDPGAPGGQGGDGGDGTLKYLGARHPILVFREPGNEVAVSKNGGTGVVPIDIILKGGKKVLVISGANTGGKTVALKTLGLLTLMAQSGLPIPAGEGSTAPFFREIFADIGDRQNIAKDLSTFSAHLKRTGEILGRASAGTLVLIDEIGVGTDPMEGSVLSLSVLEELGKRGARAVVTTHLNLLKAHAEIEETFENASVVFEEDTLRPCYELRYGLPGASLGLSVASKYGIPEDVVANARARLGHGEGAFVESLKNIEESRERLAAELKRQLELNEKKEAALKRLRDDRAGLLERARERVNALLRGAEAKIRDIVEEAAGCAKAAAALKRLREEKAALGERFTPARAGSEYLPSLGDEVEVGGSRTQGVVVTVDAGRKTAEVLSGNVKVTSKWKNLVKKGSSGTGKKANGKKGGPKSVSNLAFHEAEVSLSVNLIGMRSEEAIAEVESAIDNAHMQGLGTIELIHGVGTGRLKHVVEEYLKECSLVKGYKPGDPLRGGGGVTVVDVK